MNKFSVIMSVYKGDNDKFFDKALNSIIVNQTVVPNEVVLVVDGEVADEINTIIDKYIELFPQLFKVIRLSTNEGLGNALKLAVLNASYNLIARMDSDDISINNRFEQQLQYLENNPSIDVIGGDIAEFIGDENNIVAKRVVPQEDKDIKKYIKKRCPLNHVTVMYKKETVLKAGGYIDWFWNEDYFLWIRMFLCGATFANTGTTLVNVRTGVDMYKRRGGIKYFKSEKGLQDYMLKNKMISVIRYMLNVCERFVLQVLMPNWLRGYIFRSLAREKCDE